MGQSMSSPSPIKSSTSGRFSRFDLVDEIVNSDRTDDLPDELISHIFHFLGVKDRKSCSLVCRRWLQVDGQTRNRLSLKAQSQIETCIPSLFTRFDSINKLTLRCDRRSVSLNDDALIEISVRCVSLTRLKLRGCNAISDDGIAGFSKNCRNLKKLSVVSCNFGVKGMNAVVNNCYGLEELTVKRLRGIDDRDYELIGPGVAGSSLKSICLKEIIDGHCFEPLLMGCKNLESLKIIRSVGDWDYVLEMLGNGDDGYNCSVIDVHLERLQLSDVGIKAVSKFSNLEVLHIVKIPECTNKGLVSVAENCKKLRKLHIDGWRTNRIGDEGLAAFAKHSVNLQELVLIGVNATKLGLGEIGSGCEKLERLALCGSSSIGDPEIACVAERFLALKKLCVKGCAITDTAIEAIAWGCPNLVKVKVKKCKGVHVGVVDVLLRSKASLIVNFEAVEIEGLDVDSSDVGALESGAELPVEGREIVAGEGPSGSSGRWAIFRAKLGLFASRSWVGCAFARCPRKGDGPGNNSV